MCQNFKWDGLQILLSIYFLMLLVDR